MKPITLSSIVAALVVTTTILVVLLLLPYFGQVNSSATAVAGAPPYSSAANPFAAQTAWTSFGHGRHWRYPAQIPAQSKLQLKWQQDVGEGRAQIVGNDNTIFVASGNSRKTTEPSGSRAETVVTARSSSTGDVQWTYRLESDLSDDQETFGGTVASPQATPLLTKDRLVFLTFTGMLVCLDTAKGTEVWKQDLVKDYQAQVVQFGFASSPMQRPSQSGHMLVFAAGKKGGLLCLSISTGKLIWRCPVESFSYASPVYAVLKGEPQWIVVSREEVIGIRDTDGQSLWRYPLQSAGLTNVPCPLVVDDAHVVMSCQGTAGTVGLTIHREGDLWNCNERWHNEKLQIFYTNWMLAEPKVAISCSSRYLTTIDCETGNQLSRWRGFADGNVVWLKDHLVVLGGKGELSVLSFDADGHEFTLDQQYSLPAGRYWTAPTAINNSIYVRHENQLMCLSFQADAGNESLKNLVDGTNAKRLSYSPSQPLGVDSVQAIMTTFESKGQDAAMQLYNQVRSELTAEQRIELASAAYGENLMPLANLIMKHAKKDLPGSKAIDRQMKEWSR